MELFELILTLLIAILASSVLDQLLPRVSLPLVQIAIGVAAALLVPRISSVQINPELFLVLFIAPLLYDDTRHVDKLALWHNKVSILSLAIGLVLVCVLAVGFALNWFEPSIPLAAAFALGAALGPTDAVAVSTLSKDIHLNTRQKAMLSGEALINDASGVVSFQFAAAAAVTGTFSALNAGISFCISFFGGIALGIVCGFTLRAIKRLLKDQGLESTTVHMVLEVLTPFLVFLIGERLEVSGILAVVATGIIVNTMKKQVNSDNARLNVVSSSVWEVLVFLINGFVFVLLGTQLPLAITPTWESAHTDPAHVIGLVLLITAATIAVRFIWLLVIEAVTKPDAIEPRMGADTTTILASGKIGQEPAPLELDPFMDPLERQRLIDEQPMLVPPQKKKASFGTKVRSALTTTLAGPKGAVTLSIAFSLPYSIANRSLLIFLASGVILCTLLLANFLLPVIAPKQSHGEDEDELREAEISILRSVVKQLKANRTSENDAATRVVIRQYRDRIRRISSYIASDEHLRGLRLEVLKLQQQAVHDAIVANEVSKEAGQQYADRLKKMQRLASMGRSVKKHAKSPWMRSAVVIAPKFIQRIAAKLGKDTVKMQDKHGFAQLYKLCEGVAIDYLKSRMGEEDPELRNAARVLTMDHKAALKAFVEAENLLSTDELFNADEKPILDVSGAMKNQARSATTKVKEIQAEAYRMELEQIQVMREKGTLSRRAARDLREEVYLLQMDQAESLL